MCVAEQKMRKRKSRAEGQRTKEQKNPRGEVSTKGEGRGEMEGTTSIVENRARRNKRKKGHDGAAANSATAAISRHAHQEATPFFRAAASTYTHHTSTMRVLYVDGWGGWTVLLPSSPLLLLPLVLALAGAWLRIRKQWWNDCYLKEN